MTAETTTRFAPSPTGYLHLGHAYSAILNARRGDRFILRIEDIDNTRCKPEYEAAIYEDLAWLGLNWATPVRRQSDHLAAYESKLLEWHKMGLVYRCFKTRKDIENAMTAPHARDAAYRGHPLTTDQEEKHLAENKSWAWRLSIKAVENHLGKAFSNLKFLEEMPDGTIVEKPADSKSHGDVVLGRKDIGTSYHLSCVMDDASQGITHVIRGADLAEFAGLHTLLFALLGHEAPIFYHHKLVTDDQGKRYAKRDRSVTLRALREAGITPADIMSRLGL